MTALVDVGPTRYRTCSICGNTAEMRAVTLRDSKTVDVLMCRLCDVRKCGDCEKLNGRPAYVTDPKAFRCPRGHDLRKT